MAIDVATRRTALSTISANEGSGSERRRSVGSFTPSPFCEFDSFLLNPAVGSDKTPRIRSRCPARSDLPDRTKRGRMYEPIRLGGEADDHAHPGGPPRAQADPAGGRRALRSTD